MKCDVLVVGAGPAGLATAICCAEQGLHVRVLDRSNFPRPCVGEAVHPGAEALFERLGIAEGVRKAEFLRHSGIRVHRGIRREFIPFGVTGGRPWRGFQLWRPSFDQILLERARELGSEFIAPCIPFDAVPAPGGVKILSSAGPIECRIVIDGTGRNRWLGRQWGFPIRAFSPPLVALYEYGAGYCPGLDESPLFVFRSDGWEWLARVQKNLYQRIALRYSKHGKEFATTPTGFNELKKTQRVRGADVTWTLVDRSASLRHFLVGDAAAVLDPSSSHGILRALSSGILAAHCIARVFHNKNRFGDAAVVEYTKWQRNWFLHDVSHMKTFTHTTAISSFGPSAG